jgi:hypothetical protein
MDKDVGRVGSAETGSREPSRKGVSAASGFDPAREETCAMCGRRRPEHGGTWCYPFIPQSDAR